MDAKAESESDEFSPGLMDAEVATGLTRVRLRETILVKEGVGYLRKTHQYRFPATASNVVRRGAGELEKALGEWDDALQQATEAGFRAHAALATLTVALTNPQ